MAKVNCSSLINALLSISLSISQFAAASPKFNLERDSFGRAIIPEIEILKPGQAIPPRLFKKYPPRLFAEGMVHRFEETRPSTGNYFGTLTAAPIEYLNEARLQLVFSHRIIDTLNLGFLNQHFIRRSNGLAKVDQKGRAEFEDKMIGLKIESEYSSQNPDRPANEIRPKYAVLDLPMGLENKLEIELASTYGIQPLDGLGDVIAVLKPEVFRRATYTWGDSLFSHEYDSPEEIQKAIQPFGSKYISWPLDMRSTRYFEAQIWGRLNVLDVERFLIDGRTLSKSNEYSQLKKWGIPISTYTFVTKNGQTRAVPDTEVFAGDDSKISEYRKELNNLGTRNLIDRCEALMTF